MTEQRVLNSKQMILAHFLNHDMNMRYEEIAKTKLRGFTAFEICKAILQVEEIRTKHLIKLANKVVYRKYHINKEYKFEHISRTGKKGKITCLTM